MDLGGGGGGGQPAPQQTNVSQSTVPAYAQPYMETMLGKAQALEDTPYQTYSGQRIADFNPMQQQAFNTAAGMQTGPQAFEQGVQQYMSPYIQDVLGKQETEARRQSDIGGQQQQAQAAQAGAFGGYRDAIQRSERERNLDTQMGNIEAQGMQHAFDTATNQYNTNMQQTANVAQLQNNMGTQQQQNNQNQLSQQYQDFLNQQNHPYKQVGFMSDVLHGVPGTQSAQSIYQAPPSPVSQAAGLGTLAYGLSKMGGDGKKEGGLIRGGLKEAALKKVKG